MGNLERAGLLRYQQGRATWPQIKSKFDLLVEDFMRDISYAYSGYAPLSVRLVEKALQRAGWQGCKEAMELLPGRAQVHRPTVDYRDFNQPSLVLVCFLGGVPYAEIAALRKLSEKEKGHRRFLIVTTEMVNPKKLFEMIRCEQVFSQPPLESRKVPTQADSKRGSFSSFFGR